MDAAFMVALYVGIPVALLLVGWLVGGSLEKNHLEDLEQREAASRDVLVTDLRHFPGGISGVPQMVVGETVVASDYLKSFLARIRNIFGGEVRSYQSMMDRARREATMRMVERAREQGYDAVCNVRMYTSDLAGHPGSRQKRPMVVIYATGTAYRRPNDDSRPGVGHG